MDSMPITNGVPGDPLSAKSNILETGASLIQDVKPIKNICAHLNAFHAYADQPGRCVETSHFCSHLSEDVRQCVLYDSPEKNARLIGVEYMITPRLYETLPSEERKLWHSHVFEVKSGMLIMPKPLSAPGLDAAWETAETKEMEQVIELYGKVYHLWQVDRGDKLPLGEPKLMTSFTAADQLDFEKLVGDRDARYGSDHKQKAKRREYIPEPKLHPDADQTWMKKP